MIRESFKSQNDIILTRVGIDDATGRAMIAIEHYPKPFDRIEIILEDEEAEKVIDVLRQRKRPVKLARAS